MGGLWGLIFRGMIIDIIVVHAGVFWVVLSVIVLHF